MGNLSEENPGQENPISNRRFQPSFVSPLTLERLNEELKRRTHVVRIFPNEASCLRLTRALAAETHEDWIEATRYLNMAVLKEHKKRELLKGETRAA